MKGIGLDMKFMVIEQFKNHKAKAVYRRADEKSRMLPDGLHYVDSWVASSFDRCFQLMETENPSLFDIWIAQWKDLVEFEIVPVVSSQEAAKTILHHE